MKHHIFKAAIAVSAATVVLRLFGFLREVALAATFGAGSVTDAFVIATTVPGIVLAIVVSAISTTYIPQYTSIEGDKNKFTSSLLTLLFIVGLGFAAIFTMFPRVLVSLFASGLEPEAFELAARLLRIMVWSAIPMLLTGIFRAFLQARNIFFAAVISDALINLFAVFSILAGKAAGNLALLGVGAIVGNAASMLMLVILCVKKGLRYRPNLDLRDEHITEMFKLMLPRALSSAVLEINQIMDKNLASALLSGTVSALNYSVKVNNVVTALIGSAVGVALFPKMSELAADGDIASLKKYVSGCMASLFPVILPLTVGVVLMAKPAIRILLERGAFDPEDTARTAECLQMYAIGLLAANMSPLVTRAFYSMKKSATPAVVSAVSVAVGIALNLALIGPMGHRGLALATSTANTLCFAILLIALRKKVGTLGLRPQLIEFCKVSAAAALMGAFVWFAMGRTPIFGGSYAQCLLWTVLIAGGGAILYLAALLIMRAEPLWGILRRVSGKKS